MKKLKISLMVLCMACLLSGCRVGGDVSIGNIEVPSMSKIISNYLAPVETKLEEVFSSMADIIKKDIESLKEMLGDRGLFEKTETKTTEKTTETTEEVEDSEEVEEGKIGS